MNPTPQLTHAPPQSATPRPIAARLRGSASSDRPTWGEMFDEREALILAPAFYGPPIIFVLGPWLLLVLLAIGPFALILTVLLALALAAGMVAALISVIASPYLLIRRLRARGMAHANPRSRLHLFRNQRVSARWFGSLQPKGMS
jgi:hypothetical protein